VFPKDNLESWQQIHDFISEFPDDDYWSKWKPMVREVVLALEARGFSSSFRIGQSMHHIIFSTIGHHRLKDEPRVTLEFHPKDQAVRIAYSCSNLYFNEPLSQETVSMPNAVPSIIRYLQRLWQETKPDTQAPQSLLD
jgi:hypothetical protein